jgi:hypothetical protein
MKDCERQPYVCAWCGGYFAGKPTKHYLSKKHQDHPQYTWFFNIHQGRAKDNKAALNKALTELSRKGRYINNIMAVEKKDRPFLPARRADHENTDNQDCRVSEQHVWCTLCKKAMKRKSFKAHLISSCIPRQNMTITPQLTDKVVKDVTHVVESLNRQVARTLQGLPEHIVKIVFEMRKGDKKELALFIKEDCLAREFVHRLVIDGERMPNTAATTRNRLRILYAIHTYFMANRPTCDSLQKCLLRENWSFAPEGSVAVGPLLVQFVNSHCTYDPRTRSFIKYNDVMTISSIMQTLPDILLTQCHSLLTTDEAYQKAEAQAKWLLTFLSSPAWKMETVRRAAAQKARKSNFHGVKVSAKDISFYITNTEDCARRAWQRLQDAYEKKDRVGAVHAHVDFIGALGIAIGAYSYRRVSEPFQFTIHNYVSRPNLSEMAQEHKHLFKNKEDVPDFREHFIIESLGKGGNPVLTNIKREWEPHLEFLCNMNYRQFIGLHNDNQYILGTPGSRDGLGHPNPCSTQKTYADKCEGNVEDTKHLRSRYLRRSWATDMGKADLKYVQRKGMCLVLGHSMDVHERHYNVPAILEVAMTTVPMCQAMGTNTVEKLINSIADTGLASVDQGPQDKPM